MSLPSDQPTSVYVLTLVHPEGSRGGAGDKDAHVCYSDDTLQMHTNTPPSTRAEEGSDHRAKEKCLLNVVKDGRRMTFRDSLFGVRLTVGHGGQGAAEIQRVSSCVS